VTSILASNRPPMDDYAVIVQGVEETGRKDVGDVLATSVRIQLLERGKQKPCRARVITSVAVGASRPGTASRARRDRAG
jgi:hypothetical protein